MDKLTLAELEHAIEPYRRRGFIVISQSEGAITLSPPPESFNYLLFFVTLLLFWPISVVYLISFNNRKDKQVCVRITSQGHIEETGYTLDALEKDRGRRWWWLLVSIIALISFIAFLFWLRFRLW